MANTSGVPGLLRCAITDGTAGTRAAWLVRRCAELGAAGVEFLIVRERGLERGALLDFVRDVVAVSGEMRVLADVRVAREAGAAGVHLSAAAGSVERWPGAYVTRSCHTLEEILRAREEGVDAVLFGPVFGKWVEGVEVVPGVGVARLREAVEVAREMQVFALGGVTADNAGLCWAAGVAAIRMFFGG